MTPLNPEGAQIKVPWWSNSVIYTKEPGPSFLSRRFLSAPLWKGPLPMMRMTCGRVRVCVEEGRYESLAAWWRFAYQYLGCH